MSSFWNDFYFDGISAMSKGVMLVDFNQNDILKEYGLNFNINLSTESVDGNAPIYNEGEKSSDNIIIQLCKRDNKPWALTDLLYLYKWLFTSNFKRFQISDFSDKRYNIAYYLKAVKKTEHFTPNMEGYVEIEFQSYEPYAYIIPATDIRLSNGTSKTVFSYSNLPQPYKPIFKITNHGNKESNIKISNLTNGTSFNIMGLEYGEIVYVDCKIGSVTNIDNENRFEVLQDYNFISLEMGNNDVYLEGSAIVDVICEFPILL